MLDITWTKLEREWNHPAFWQFFFHGELFRKIGVAIIGSSPRDFYRMQKESKTVEEFERALFEKEARGASSYLVRQLARRALSEHESRNVLKKQGVSIENIDAAVEKAKSYGYIEDLSIAQSYSATLFSQKKSSRTVLTKIQKRFGSKADLFIENLIEDEEKLDRENLQVLIVRGLKVLEKKGGATRENMQKLIARLCRKGFSYELIQTILKDIS